MKPRGSGHEKKGSPAIIIRRAAEAEQRHHSGAWKIAYADFITAMMAFFLLLWLVNATTESQRTGIADYFAPSNLISSSRSGAGQMFGGRTLASDGRLASDAPLAVRTQRANNLPSDEEPDTSPQHHLFHHSVADAPENLELGGRERSGAVTASQQAQARQGRQPNLDGPAASDQTPVPLQQGTEPIPDNPPVRGGQALGSTLAVNARSADRRALGKAAEELRAIINTDPQLQDLGRQLLIEEAPEGLRIQLVDSDGQAVFATGQAAPNERGRHLLLRAAQIIARLPNSVEITGYTDAAPFRSTGTDRRTNWDLSTERANATRRLLVEAGVAEQRLRGVIGRADTEPLRPEQPFDAANRRVSILVRVDDRLRTPGLEIAPGAAR
jgi:chemotaxis protein MotB